jgi:hypothetical protein
MLVVLMPADGFQSSGCRFATATSSRSSPNFEATVAAYQKDVAEFFSDSALESDVSRAVPQHLLVLGCNRADLSDETEQMNGEVWHAALAIVWVALGRVWARALPASAATGLGFVLFTCHLRPMLPIEGVRNLRRRRRGATSRRKSRRNRFFRAARARKWASLRLSRAGPASMDGGCGPWPAARLAAIGHGVHLLGRSGDLAARARSCRSRGRWSIAEEQRAG